MADWGCARGLAVPSVGVGGMPCALGAGLGFAAALTIVFIFWALLLQLGIGDIMPRIYHASLVLGLLMLCVGMVR